MPFTARTRDIETDWEMRAGKQWWKKDDGSTDPEILLRQVGPNAFQLMEGFRYELPKHARRKDKCWRWDVPAHRLDLAPDAHDEDNSTDLASVPAWLWWFVASHGRQTRAALLHDHLIGDSDTPNKQADRAFRIALIESDVSVLRAWIMWTAVSLASTARRKVWGRLAVAVFGVQVGALFASLLYLWLGRYSWWPAGWISQRLKGGSWWPLDGTLWATDAGEPLWGRLWLAPLALGVSGLLIWWRRWVFGVIGAALIALPTLFVWVTYLAAGVLDWSVTIACRAAAALARSDIRIPSPNLGKPYRRQARPF